jgi:hypothetical protein
LRTSIYRSIDCDDKRAFWLSLFAFFPRENRCARADKITNVVPRRVMRGRAFNRGAFDVCTHVAAW